jgi:quinol monooxygenase YgiN
VFTKEDEAMFIRGTRVQTSPDKVDAAIAHFREKVAPTARATPGNAGAVLLIDRKTGAAIGSTYWESARAMAASEQMGSQTRTQSAAAIGSQIVNVERFEIVLMEREAPAKEGTFVRINSANGDPDKVDALAASIRNQILPVLKAQKGFRSVIYGVDRQTGRSVTSTTWDTLADLQASERAIAGMRKDAAATGGAQGAVEIEIFEGAVIDMPAAVAAAGRG